MPPLNLPNQHSMPLYLLHSQRMFRRLDIPPTPRTSPYLAMPNLQQSSWIPYSRYRSVSLAPVPFPFIFKNPFQPPSPTPERERQTLRPLRYVSIILSSTHHSIEKVTILPNGTWEQIITPQSDPPMFSEANPFEPPSTSAMLVTPPSTSSTSFHEPTTPVIYTPADTTRPITVIEISSDDESDSESDERPLIRRRTTTSSSSQRGVGAFTSWSDIEVESAGGGALWQNNDQY